MRVERPQIHWSLLVVTGCLTVIGLVNLFSALHLWGGGGHLRLFWMQCLWTVVGGCLMGLVARYDYRLLQRSTSYWVWGTLILLAAVVFFGRDVGGNRNWLGIGGLGIQPSELAKLVVIFSLAKFYTDRPNPYGYQLVDLLRPMGLLGLMMALIALGGDLGTTLFIGLVGGSMIAFNKLRWASIVVVIVGITIAGGIVYRVAMTPAQQSRVTTFLHPEADPRGKGYHVLQSRIAVGSGKVWGRGYLRGTVNKLRYLPERHTDFIFPVLAEEWGFLGCSVTLLCYLILLTVGVAIAGSAGDRFGGLLGLGIVFGLFWQIAVNLGGVLGLLPLTGVTLPFLSYGGSSLVVTYAAIGLLLAIDRRKYLF